MTAPRNSRITAGSKRVYSWRNEAYWSVTTILSGGIPKPALLPWGIKMVAEGAADLANELPALVAKDRDAAVKMLKGLPYSARDRAADLGSIVHAAAEAYALGKPYPKWPTEAEPRMAAFLRFLDDHQPEYHATEASVYNRTQKYAGTLDFIATVNGRKLIGDVKTSKGVYPEVALQLAAYRHAEFIGLPDGSEAEMTPVEGAVCLHLTDDGYRLMEVDAGPETFRYFLFAREVFRWQEQASKGVLLGDYPATLDLVEVA